MAASHAKQDIYDYGDDAKPEELLEDDAKPEESLDDVPEHERRCDPFWGARTVREIEGKMFAGHVVEIERGSSSKELVYRIEYEDGDLQHLTREEMIQHQAKDNQTNNDEDEEQPDEEQDEEEVEKKRSSAVKGGRGKASAKTKAAKVGRGRGGEAKENKAPPAKGQVKGKAKGKAAMKAPKVKAKAALKKPKGKAAMKAPKVQAKAALKKPARR